MLRPQLFNWALGIMVGACVVTTWQPNWAQAQSEIPVSVFCKSAEIVAGAPLRVLARATPGGMFGQTFLNPVFDSDGRAEFHVPPGIYRFEVLNHRVQGAAVVLKSDPVKIRRRSEVELSALPPQPLRLELAKRGVVTIEEFAVRSESATGEYCWRQAADQELPTVIASADQRYRVRLIGRSHALAVPVWVDVPGEQWTVALRERSLFSGTFQIRDDAPQVREATALFGFPDSQLELAVTPDTEILTNRRFVSFAYRVETEQGRRIQTHPQLGTIRKSETFDLGGPYRPMAWFGLMKARTEDGSKCLIWGADLVDPRGYLVNTDQSTIDWRTTCLTPWGKVEPDCALTKSQEALCGSATGAVRVKAEWYLGGPQSEDLQAIQFQKFSIPRIKTTGPPHWKIQIGNYLAKAARVYQCIEEVDGKPGKHTVDINWHRKGGAALATVGGKNAWINMPFGQLIKNFDPYATPWALPHEMLHNFGYGHGDKMKAAQEATKHKLDLFRWYMADHPEMGPDDAFARFRLFQRGAPWDIR